jgi:hypothetical protein
VEKTIAGGATTVYVYYALGKLAAEYATAPVEAPCTTCYLVWDQLGSTRLVTDQNANVVARHDYLPFGEEIAGGTAGRNGQWGPFDNVNQKFTGQIRDSETGQDFFNARYFTGASNKPTINGIGSVSGFVRGNALQGLFRAATGPATITSIVQGGEVALQGGITASEYASGAALAKLVYDGATFLYGYFGECQ